MHQLIDRKIYSRRWWSWMTSMYRMYQGVHIIRLHPFLKLF